MGNGNIGAAVKVPVNKFGFIGNAQVAHQLKGPHGGNLYKTPTGEFEVYGAILAKYVEYGGPFSFLGLPETNETGCPDGVGRFNHFQGGSIYWTPDTGAHVIFGAIRDRWAVMGWENSYLGYPTSDEIDFEGGRINTFQRGQIYWWPDTGAIDLNDVVVHYTGLVCFGETDSDQMSDSDEPYALLSVTTPTSSYAVRTQVYTDVDDGESRLDLVEVYRGKPNGLVIGTVVMENDEGDPDKYKDLIQEAVQKVGDVIAGAIKGIPWVGDILGDLPGKGINAAVPVVAEELNTVFDFGDDRVGSGVLPLSPKQLVLLAARTPNSDFMGIGFKAETPLISGMGASYKAYFGVVPT